MTSGKRAEKVKKSISIHLGMVFKSAERREMVSSEVNYINKFALYFFKYLYSLLFCFLNVKCKT